jgi:hypothetical protein
VLGLVLCLNGHATTHLPLVTSTLNSGNLALFGARGTWPHGPMRPTPPFLGAVIPLTVQHFGTDFGRHACAEFRHEKFLEARFTHTRGQNGEPGTELEGGKMAGGLTS